MPFAAKQSKAKNASDRAVSKTVPAAVSWPAFEPLTAIEDLNLHELYAGQILTASGFLDAHAVQEIRDFPI